MMSESKLVIALLAGLAAGAVLGILLAPEAGPDTREKINESLANLGESIKNWVSEQLDKFGQFSEKIAGKVKEQFGEAEGDDYPDDLEHA